MNPETAKSAFSKFTALPFRPYQGEAVDFVLNRSVAPVVASDAPTGFGKSLFAMCALEGAGGGLYAIGSKQLQDQLSRDFPEAAVLKGRGNYFCKECKADNCSQGRIVGCTYAGCPYKIAKEKALDAKITIVNYAYLLLEMNYIGDFSGRPLIVCDEGDLLENMLIDFCSPGISQAVIRDLNLPKPDRASTSTDEGLGRWKFWGRAVNGIVQRTAAKTLKEIKSGAMAEKEILAQSRRLDTLRSLGMRLKVFIDNVDKDWIFDEKKSGAEYGDAWSFKPLWITKDLAHRILWRHASRFLVMSATLSPPSVFPMMHGLPQSKIAYWPIASSFQPERRLVFVNPVANMTAKTFNEEIGPLCAEITAILENHPGEKGLIHCVSYKLGRAIKARVRSDRLVFHENGKDKMAMVEMFEASSKPLVLLSPSCERGVDFPGDKCRFSIWAKAPWLSLGDKVVKRRANYGRVGKQWYASTMLRAVIQGAGRASRSAEDFSTTYLLDHQIFRVIRDNVGMLPEWFRAALRYYDWRNRHE